MDKNDFLKEVGQRVRKRRQELGMSQETLASIIGRTQDSISMYESGSRAMRISEVPFLAEALGVSISYLLDEAYTPGPSSSQVKRLTLHNRRKVEAAVQELFVIEAAVRTFLRDFDIDDELIISQMTDSIILNRKEIYSGETGKYLLALWERLNQNNK